MQIQSVQANEDNSSWNVVLNDGQVLTVPQTQSNRHALEVQKWINNGGVVIQHESPPEPTEDDEIDKMGRIFLGFLRAYADREGLTMHQVRTRIKAHLE